MAYIPNTEYITINKNGFFIGDKEVVGIHEGTKGKKETLFHGHTIYATESFAVGYTRFDNWFESIQRRIPNIEEIHVGAFDTKATKYEQGFPSGKFGKNTWCRIKLKDKDATYSPWVFYYDHLSDWDCVSRGGRDCVKDLVNEPDFVAAVLDAANTDTKQSKQQQNTSLPENDAQITEFKQKLQSIDLSKLTRKTIELNGYKITIRKIAQNTKTNKR